MKNSRRTFLIRSGLLFSSVFGVYSLSSGVRDWLKAQIEADFGYEMADNIETSAFLSDYLKMLETEKPKEEQLASAYFRFRPEFLPPFLGSELAMREHLLNAFIRSTNAIMVLEDNRPFIYSGIFNPTVSPCQNQLSAFMI